MSLYKIVQGRMELDVHQREASWEIQWNAVTRNLSALLSYHCKERGILNKLASSSL